MVRLEETCGSILPLCPLPVAEISKYIQAREETWKLRCLSVTILVLQRFKMNPNLFKQNDSQGKSGVHQAGTDTPTMPFSSDISLKIHLLVSEERCPRKIVKGLSRTSPTHWRGLAHPIVCQFVIKCSQIQQKSPLHAVNRLPLLSSQPPMQVCGLSFEVAEWQHNWQEASLSNLRSRSFLETGYSGEGVCLSFWHPVLSPVWPSKESTLLWMCQQVFLRKKPGKQNDPG